MYRDNILGKKVLALYACGSSIHGFDDSTSDADYTAILDDFEGISLYHDDGKDYFIFGYETFKRAVQFNDENIPHSYLMWLDNIVLAEDHLVYIDEEFADEFSELIKIDWDKYFKKWLAINLDYFTAVFSLSFNLKPLYNLYRIRSLVKHYKETGVFEYFLSDEDRALIIDHKINKSISSEHSTNFANILEYLRSFIVEEE